MKERNNKMELLGNAPIPKALMALGIPIMIGMLINALYNLVDAYFVGGLGESQMGAISIVFPLGQVVVGLGLMFGNGAASYLSRLLGRGDKDTANKVASTALYSSVLVGAIIIILATIFLKPILTLLGATDTIMPYALTYARIYVVSCIFNVFNVTMNNIVTSEGAAKTTMCALLLGAILNIGLDPIFIYVLEMGVAGAAIATAISQLVSTLVYLNYVLRKKSAFTFSVREFAPTKQMMAEILKIGVPTLTFQLLTSLSIQQVFVSVGFMSIQFLINGFGTDCMAAYTAASKVDSFAEMPALNLGQAMTNFAAQNYGAKKMDRVIKGGKSALVMGVGVSVLISTVICLFPSSFISIFNRDPGVIQIGNSYLRTVSVFYFVFAAMQILNGILLGYGKSFVPMLASIGSLCLMQVPAAIILSRTSLGYNGIWIAAPVGWFGGLTIRFLYFRYIARK